MQSTPVPNAQPLQTPPQRPPNYIVRAIILLLVLTPLGLLLGVSSLYTAWILLTGPPFRSEIPAWWEAVMQLLRALVGFMGFFMPIVALINALKVNREFDAGNYGGAASASKSAAKYCKQGIIFVVLIIIMMAVDVLRYVTSEKR